MAFKIKRFIPQSSPVNLVDPGKILKAVGASVFPVANTIVDAVKGASKTVKAYKARNYKDPVDNKPKVKVKSQATKDGEAGYDADDKARKNKTGIYAPKQKKTRKKVSAIKTPKAAKINVGNKKAIAEKDVLDSTPKISTKKPTAKTAPKDNSRKAIRKRKKADKAAGVSKSQMRANKAQSKSEAALEKAKKSKNPSYRAQLKAKSDRLAKRAKRKGNS